MCSFPMLLRLFNSVSLCTSPGAHGGFSLVKLGFWVLFWKMSLSRRQLLSDHDGSVVFYFSEHFLFLVSVGTQLTQNLIRVFKIAFGLLWAVGL